jgi:TatD DNase family protein
MLVDSHCHLNYPEFQEDFDQMVERAKTLGVQNFLTISTALSTVQDVIKIAERRPEIFCTIGVHPHEVEKEGVPSVETLLDLTKHPKVVGIGETGLDYYYDHSPRDVQQQSFRNHIRVAKETGLPLIIHSREAEDDILKILQEEKIQDMTRPGVIHCFTGTKDFALQCMALGFYISASGIVTFSKALDLQDIIQNHIPLDRLLVETDAPYLAPVPHRGKRNEPSFVVHTAEKVATLKEVPLSDVASKTTENFFHLFEKIKRDPL